MKTLMALAVAVVVYAGPVTLASDKLRVPLGK
jgi:hypothetical protein